MRNFKYLAAMAAAVVMAMSTTTTSFASTKIIESNYQYNTGSTEIFEDELGKWVSAKYSCGFSIFLVSSIIVGERYLDYFTTITEDRL